MEHGDESTPGGCEQEIEILESIFGEKNVVLVKKVWGFPTISLRIQPHVSTGDVLEALIEIAYVAGYPRNPVIPSLSSWKGITEKDAKRLETCLINESKRKAGPNSDFFVYDLAQYAQDFLIDHRVSSKSFYEQNEEKKRMVSQKAEEEKRALEEAEHEQESHVIERVNRALREDTNAISSLTKPAAWQTPIPPILEGNGLGFDAGSVEVAIPGILSSAGNSNSRYQHDFEEIKPLGRGGFGTVVMARNKLDGLSYAIKKIRIKRGDALSNRKIIREVTSLAKVFHKNIVRYYHAWIEDDPDAENYLSGSEDDYASQKSPYDIGLRLSHENGELEMADFPDVSEYELCGYDDHVQTFTAAFESKAVFPSRVRTQSMVSDGILNGSSPSFAGTSEVQYDDFSKPKSRGLLLYIQMELCPGRSLREVIDQRVLVDNPALVGKLLRGIVEALYYIHDKCHFIHRDLKPANVFLDEGGNVKLGDFGLAIAVEKGSKGGVDDEKPNEKKKNLKNRTKSKQKANKQPKNFDMWTKNTSGVGTGLYRAPEILSGNYNEKCDMWSLGIMLFEMMVQPFETEMERSRTLTELRSSHRVPLSMKSTISANKELNFDWVALIEELLRNKPHERPSAKMLLESGRLPQAIETEQNAFEEVMHVVKGSDRSNPLFLQLMEALFEQDPRPELIVTYDADLLKFADTRYTEVNSSGCLIEDTQRRLETLRLMKVSVMRRMERQFQLSGAILFSSPLLLPKEINSNAHTLNSFRLMDPQGTVVFLATNLTQPFSRWVALSGVSWFKRYDFSRVYFNSETKGSLLGGQPTYKLQGSLDVVIPVANIEGDTNEDFSCIWHYDLVKTSVRALVRSGNWAHDRAISDEDITVYIQDSYVQEALVQSCQLGSSRFAATREISLLDTLFSSGHLRWQDFRKRGLKFLSQKQVDSLRQLVSCHFDQKKLIDAVLHLCTNRTGLKEEGIQRLNLACKMLKYFVSMPSFRCVFRPWLLPISDMNSGLFYAIVVNNSSLPPSENADLIQANSKDIVSGDGVCASFSNMKSFVAATGGRYDDLVKHCQRSLKSRKKVAVLGTRFHIERLAHQLLSPQQVFASKLAVLVAAPSDQKPATIKECAEVVDTLRENGIRAEFSHPFMHSEHSQAPLSDQFISYCRKSGISLLVNKKGNMLRVRGAYSPSLDREFSIDDLVRFIKDKL